MHPRFLALGFFVVVSLAGPVLGQQDPVTISVIPTLAPNAFGSPSWDAWNANAIYALENGLSSYGDPASPTYYSAAPLTLPVSDNVVTNFPSWLGQANPSGNFAGEYGNRLTFGLVVDGNGSLISISELGFSSVSTDPYDTLGAGFSYAAGSYDYSDSYVGVIWGQDGNPNTYVTSGPNTQLVNEIIGRGSGNAWEALTGDPLYWPGPTEQDMIGQVGSAYDLPSNFSFTGTYTLGDAQGSATVDFVNVPDAIPAAECFAGALAALATVRRRRVRA